VTFARLPDPTHFDHGQRREALVQSLLAEVFDGRLKAGQRLVAQELANRYGVSQTPIREALITLAAIGIVDLQPNRGAVVRAVTPREVREVCEVREALECTAVRSACGRVPTATIMELIGETTALVGKQDVELIPQAQALDNKLHDTIANSADNVFLAQELGRLKTLFRSFRDLSWTHDAGQNDGSRIGQEAEQHLAILNALQAKDRRAAARAMAKHIRSGVRYWSRAVTAPTGEETN
jgi:DNA-binding GntR family transcriptional regulator